MIDGEVLHLSNDLSFESGPLEDLLSAFAINVGLNDAWFNPLTNGQGLFIIVFPGLKQLFVSWFTYDVQRPPGDVTAILGEPGHRWVTAQGSYNGDTAQLTVYVSSGGTFDSTEPVPVTDPDGIGTMTIRFAGCDAALLSYDIPGLGLASQVPLQRITLDNVALCQSLAAH